MIRSKVLTESQIQQIIKNLIDDTLAFAEKCRTQGAFTAADADVINSNAVAELAALSVYDGSTDSGTSYGDANEFISSTIKELTDRIRYRQFDTDRVDNLLNAAGYDEVDKGSMEYQQLCREHLKAWQFVNQIELERNNGNYDNPYDVELRSRPKSDKLSDVLQTVRRSSIMNDTINKVLDCLQAETGQTDILLSDLTYRLIDKVTDRLSRYPLKRFINYPGIPLDEVPLQPHVKYVSPATAKGDVKRFKSILAAAENFSGYGKWNLNELTKKDALKSTSTGKTREHFYPEDLELIVAELKRRKDKGEFKKNPHLLLIPFIALFQGMRQNEICQLRVTDIIQVDGLWCISVNEEYDADGPSGKKVKSKNSIRVMPVHPELEKLGLIRFWESQRNKRRVRLWEGEQKVSCALGTDGKHNKLYGQWFLREVRNKIKLQYSRRDKQCFHSFRHTFSGWFKLNLQTYDRAAAVVLTGHLDEKDKAFLLTETELYKSYDSSLPVRRLYDTLIRLDYGLDLSGLVI